MTEIIFDINQLCIAVLLMLMFYFIFMGYMTKKSSGGIMLLISSGITFNLTVLMITMFGGVLAVGMTPLFVGLIVLLVKDGMKKMKT